MKQAIIYTIKVWLTSVVLSPIAFIIADNLFHSNNRIGLYGSLGFIGYSIPYGLVITIPCWLILFLSAGSLVNRKLKMIYKKSIISVVGVALSILPFFLLFRGDDNGFDLYTKFWSLSYCTFIVGGIWLYEFKA